MYLYHIHTYVYVYTINWAAAAGEPSSHHEDAYASPAANFFLRCGCLSAALVFSVNLGWDPINRISGICLPLCLSYYWPLPSGSIGSMRFSVYQRSHRPSGSSWMSRL